MIGSYGGNQLLTWLNQYTFPKKAISATTQHARDVCRSILKELLRNATTPPWCLHGSIKVSVDCFF